MDKRTSAARAMATAAVAVGSALAELDLERLPRLAGLDFDAYGEVQASCQISATGGDGSSHDTIGRLVAWLDALPGLPRLLASEYSRTQPGTWRVWVAAELAGVRVEVWDHIHNLPRTLVDELSGAGPLASGDLLLEYAAEVTR